jgi:hypothetical protein
MKQRIPNQEFFCENKIKILEQQHCEQLNHLSLIPKYVRIGGEEEQENGDYRIHDA